MKSQPADPRYPSRWADMSLDFRCLFGYAGCIVVLTIIGGTVPVRVMAVILVVLLSSIACISLLHRIRCGWRWPGIGAKDIWNALVALLVFGFVFGGMLLGTSPSSPVMFSCLALGGGMALFGVLGGLRVVCLSKAEFLSNCGQQIPIDDPINPGDEIPWKKTARRVYTIFFATVWIASIGYSWVFNAAYKNGSQSPAADRTVALNDHGRIVYITHHQEQAINVLLWVMGVGIPSAILAGFILQKRYGVALYKRVPLRGPSPGQ